ncbi:MAG: hypothetical protein ACJ739_08470 [Acidimicrobiales bacterium]
MVGLQSPPIGLTDRSSEPPTDDRLGVRRYTRAALIGLLAALGPFLWVLWNGRLDPARNVGYATAFYEVQARALAHGHWWVPEGSLGIEAFVVHGRHYSYFGPFPAVLRMPVLLFTHSLDGRLTAPSMLLAWVVAAGFSAGLLWRIRVLARGGQDVSRSEAIACALLLFTIMGGSTLLYLGSLPWVFHEALAWGFAWTAGSMFALLGVLERPSTRRILLAGLCILCAVMSRSTVGWASALGAVMVGVWYASGRAGADSRRWSMPAQAAGLQPSAAGCAVTNAKFGSVLSLPMGAQTYPELPQHRLLFLEANHGRSFSLDFLPSTLLAYLRPDGLDLSSRFPYLTMPSGPPKVLGGAVFDMTYRTSSVTAAMPLLLVLTVIGCAALCRRHPTGRLSLTRVPVLVGAAGAAGVLFFGFLVNRYVADFLPLLLVGSAVGMIELWRRVEQRSRRSRRVLLSAIGALALFGSFANLGIATEAATLGVEAPRLVDYVKLQERAGQATGHPIRVTVARELPATAPAGDLWATPDCGSLYMSTGELYFPRWLAVERGPAYHHIMDVTYRHFDLGRVPLVSAGGAELFIEDKGLDYYHYVRLVLVTPGETRSTEWTSVNIGVPRKVEVISDVAFHQLTVMFDGRRIFDEDELPTTEPGTAWDAPARVGPFDHPISFDRQEVPEPQLCDELVAR